MIIYIAGPMTGITNKNKPAFDDLARQLTEAHHVVLNPARLPEGLTYQQYMDIDLAMVRACDAVFTLPGWQNSPGASAEVAYARCLGKNVVRMEKHPNDPFYRPQYPEDTILEIPEDTILEVER